MRAFALHPDRGMNVNLTPDLEKLVRDKVDSGLYNCEPHPHESEGNKFLRLGSCGNSEVNLSFELPEGSHGACQLVLFDQKNLRRYYPMSGEANVEVLWDEVVLETHAAGVDNPEHVIPIEGVRHRPGPHKITIRLDRSSTTPYRLHRVALRLGPASFPNLTRTPDEEVGDRMAER